MTSRFMPASLKAYPDTNEVLFEGTLYNDALALWYALMTKADHRTESRCHREAQVLLDPAVAKAIAEGKFKKYTPQGKAILSQAEITQMEADIQASINSQELI